MHYIVENNIVPIDAFSKKKLPASSLIYAIIQESLPIVQFLIEQGADINLLTTDGNSAVHLAVQTKNIHILQAVLKSDKPFLNQTNMNGRTASDLSILLKQPKMSKLLSGTSEENSADSEEWLALVRAIAEGSVQIEGVVDGQIIPIFGMPPDKTPDASCTLF